MTVLDVVREYLNGIDKNVLFYAQGVFNDLEKDGSDVSLWMTQKAIRELVGLGEIELVSTRSSTNPDGKKGKFYKVKEINVNKIKDDVKKDDNINQQTHQKPKRQNKERQTKTQDTLYNIMKNFIRTYGFFTTAMLIEEAKKFGISKSAVGWNMHMKFKKKNIVEVCQIPDKYKEKYSKRSIAYTLVDVEEKKVSPDIIRRRSKESVDQNISEKLETTVTDISEMTEAEIGNCIITRLIEITNKNKQLQLQINALKRKETEERVLDQSEQLSQVNDENTKLKLENDFLRTENNKLQNTNPADAPSHYRTKIESMNNDILRIKSDHRKEIDELTSKFMNSKKRIHSDINRLTELNTDLKNKNDQLTYQMASNRKVVKEKDEEIRVLTEKLENALKNKVKGKKIKLHELGLVRTK